MKTVLTYLYHQSANAAPILILVFIALIPAGCTRNCYAQTDVDYDKHLVVLEKFLGSSFPLRGRDGDGNGINEDDQLGMLGIILHGGSEVSNIEAARISAIQSAYPQNLTATQNELTVTIQGNTRNIITELNNTNPELGEATLHVVAGLMTVADTSTIVYLNNLADSVVAEFLRGTPAEDETSSVQNQINFTANDFHCFGNAGTDPNYLGAQGDIDNDSLDNLTEYTQPSPKTREEWLQACDIVPRLRLVSVQGGGLKTSGQVLTFSVTAAGGAGPVTYEWRKGSQTGSSTLLGTDPTYTIGFANTSDNGSYFCRYTDGVTQRSTPTLSLTVVYVPLQITQHIQGGTRSEGGTFTFTVAVMGGQPGPYQFTWRKNGEVVGPNAATFTLSPLQVSDSGNYSVTVTSNGGPDAVTSGPVTLTVTPNVPALSITEQPQGASRFIGESHTFRITVTGGSGTYNYTWRKNGTAIAGAPNAPEFTIASIQATDEGNYSCRVTDAVYTTLPAVTSANAFLDVVLEPLNIVEQPQSATREVGQSVTFSVYVEGGSGTYTYTWRKNGNNISGAPNAREYTIASVTQADAGSYSCFVRDAVDTTLTALSDSAILEVVSATPLSIVQQPQGALKYIGEAHTLSVVVNGGSGNYRYAWTKNGAPFCGCSQPSVTLSPLSLSDAGTYVVNITDQVYPELSAVSEPAVLQVGEPLTIVTHPSGGNFYIGSTVVLEVGYSGGLAPITVEWYKDTAKISGVSTPTLDITPMRFLREGNYFARVTDQRSHVDSNIVTLSALTRSVPTGGLEFNLDLTGSAVVPPTSSVAFGRGLATLMPSTRKSGGGVLTLSLLHSVSNPTSLGVYAGAVDVPGEMLLNLGTPASSYSGTIELDAEAASAIASGLAFLQINSVTYPNGEIRGQFFVPEEPTRHSGDPNGDFQISLSELLRLIQFYNVGVLSCDAASEDGYAPGPGPQDCSPHSSDYNPQDWRISLSELLRFIQFYNSPGHAYHACAEGEDGYCPGPESGT